LVLRDLRNPQSVDEVLGDVIYVVNVLDGKGYGGRYGLALAPPGEK
jgi:hypothetical protein